jgi:hypothetical protein
VSYDIIGDIHGEYGKLEALLRKLGYVEEGRAWRHPSRQAIFVGDFIDRGREQLQTVRTVRRMIDAGTAQAVMGNHELNAIAWHTPDPSGNGDFLRTRLHPELGPRHRKQHGAFLREVEQDPALHAELVAWFLSLPLWIDLPHLRVTHACWHQGLMDWVAPHLREGRYLTPELVPAATTEPDEAGGLEAPPPSLYAAVECITKGVEVPLPDGCTFVDNDGHTRRHVRVRWWDTEATTYRSAALLAPHERERLPDEELPAHARIGVEGTPVFFGHYWLTGSPRVESERCACVDFSVANGGPLVAYRFDGEPTLSAGKLVWVC